MSILAKRFAAIPREKRCGFIPFVVAGDPDLETSAAVIVELSRVKPVTIEVGVPFSDPTADGPVIQRAAERSLHNGNDLSGILAMLERIKSAAIAPLVLFSYYNPILQFGLEKFARRMRRCGVAGVLVVDLPADSAQELQQLLRREGIDLILLVAPTSSDARLKQIARLASGFIYAVARTGVTGNAGRLADESRDLVARIRRITDVPVAVGFGISKREHARRVCRYADAAVVGSRIVGEIERAAARPNAGRDAVIRAVRRCAAEFR